MKMCPNCGESIVDIARFCPRCAHNFADVATNSTQRINMQNKQNNINLKIILGVVAVITVVVIISTCLIFGYECKHKKTQKVGAIAATCTVDGLTEGVMCLKCELIISGRETVPAAGHSYRENLIQGVTCTADGSKECVCTVCGYKEIQTIEATGHTFSEYVIKNATCTEEGSKRLICTVCDYEETQVVTAEHAFEKTKNGKQCNNCALYVYDEDALQADTWYTYTLFDSLALQNCLIIEVYPIGKSVSVLFYPICKHCHAVKGGIWWNETVSFDSPYRYYYYCLECSGTTLVRLEIKY